MQKDLVSICIPTWNGSKFIAAALESMLAQDYRNIEVVILDNRSTDDTKLICTKFAVTDSRVRYILDDVMVGDPEGHHKVATFARGEYFLIACDDDVYDRTYISRLLALLKAHPGIGLAYSGFNHINEVGEKIESNLKKKYFLSANNSKFYNFCFYLLHRTPIPLSFGLLRTEEHMESLKYFYRLDKNRGDHDNLYMLRLLSLTRVASIEDRLFSYRIKDRSTQFSRAPRGLIETYLGTARHQWNVSRVVAEIVSHSDFSLVEKIAIKVFIYIVLSYNLSGQYLLQSGLVRALRSKRNIG